MSLEPSILKSTKKILNLGAAYTEFDLDVLTHINTCFFTLNQLGVGPPEGFMIESDEETWQEFTQGNLNLNSVKTYIYLKVRSLFDPPGTPHHVTMLNEQIAELEHRLKMEREMYKWTSPTGIPGLPPSPSTGAVTIQGGDLDD